MPRIVCMKCQTFFHPLKNGVTVEEGMPRGPNENPVWLPYKIWWTDLWECRQCGTVVAAGFPPDAVVEHYQPEYEGFKAKHPPVAFVKDCL